MDPIERYLLNQRRENRLFYMKWSTFYLLSTVMLFIIILLVRYHLLFKPNFSRLSELYSYLRIIDVAYGIVLTFVGFIVSIVLGNFLNHWRNRNREFREGFHRVVEDRVSKVEAHLGEFENQDYMLTVGLWTGVLLAILTLVVLIQFVHFQLDAVLVGLGTELHGTELVQSVEMSYSQSTTGSVIRVLILGTFCGVGFLVHYYLKKRKRFSEQMMREILSNKYDGRVVIRNEDDRQYISYCMAEDISLRAVEDKRDVKRFAWKEIEDKLGEEYRLVSGEALLEEARRRAEWYREDVFDSR